MPTILLVNDDGVHSKGLLILKRELDKIGKTVVVAPVDKSSGAGKSLTFHEKIKIAKVHLSDGSEAYTIDGTPADAVLLGLYKIFKNPPDLLISGINLGHNMNIDDVLSSGTLGAAFEAAIHNVPAIAISSFVLELPSINSEGKLSLEELELSAEITRKTAKYILDNGMPEDVDVISINIPEKADPKKMKITKMSYLGYKDIYVKHEDDYIVKCNGEHHSDNDPETDVYTIKNEGVISITPITLRFPHKREKLEDLLNFLISVE